MTNLFSKVMNLEANKISGFLPTQEDKQLMLGVKRVLLQKF